MPIITRKPRSASLRFQTFLDTSDLTTSTPEKSLVVGLRKTGGRNAYGRITMRHKGGGARQLYRIVDFRRSQKDIEGVVKTVEYDPNRNVRIGLVVYKNGAKHYNLLPEGVAVGSKIMASVQAEPKPGNSLPLKLIPMGFFVHNIEMKPGCGGKLVRSAGLAAQILAHAELTTLRMPSGEIRMISSDCWATVGTLGNADFKNITWGKAGRSRHRGIRSSVRGMAMNPVDHPHGGGEGRSKSGSHPVTPWGKGCKGTRTRKRKDPRILKRRK
ncbi:50S ribosomal protein L2 [bacterium]|jgi:large subunit ribosomal protein L2|nr:50S ribosomal protein L2 [bacterium]NBX78741.1 50S ribosomal protein L2 [bacterium]